MTAAADRLRQLAADATSGPWMVVPDGGDQLEIVTHPEAMTFVVQLHYNDEADARLIALAPELALLVCDMADALEAFAAQGCKPGTEWRLGDVGCGICDTCNARALLARLDTLTEADG